VSVSRFPVNVATIYSPTDENIALLSEKLLAGELVAVPTETVYGLAGNAYDERACAEIFRAKRRPAFDPLIVHLPSGFPIETIAKPSPLLEKLAERFWPGPLTVVLEKLPIIPDLVTSGNSSVAIRVPRHPIFQKLLKACGRPLAAPSANPFSYISPTTAQHVQDGLGSVIPSILDGGYCEVGVESTIVDIRTPNHPALLRPGGIPSEAIEEVLGKKLEQREGSSGEVMPGQLKKHYSPRTECGVVNRIDAAEVAAHPDQAFLFYRRPEPSLCRLKNVFWLCEDGNQTAAAQNLFKRLREIDSGGFARLRAERAPEGGLGLAINDRLQRAATSA